MRFVDQISLVSAIHNTPVKCVLSTTGGGTEIFPILLARGGGSATFIGGNIPYSGSITKKTMGGTPDKLVDEPVGRILAMSAFQMALEHRDSTTDPIFGVGGTSILQRTPDERPGRKHVIYAAVQTPAKTISVTLDIPPDHEARTGDGYQIRATEEHVNALVMLNLIAEACDLDERIELPHKLDDLIDRRESQMNHYLIPWLLTGRVPAMCFACGGGQDRQAIVPASVMPASVLMPGSYRPMHDGHMEMYMKSGGCHLELSIANADKPWVDLLSLEERLASIAKLSKLNAPIYVWVTTEPTFLKKAELFPGSVFAVGMDTAKRIVDPRYGTALAQVVAGFKQCRTKFMVFPRMDGGIFENDLNGLPDEFAALCTLVDGFRNDLSSTHIRKQAHA